MLKFLTIFLLFIGFTDDSPIEITWETLRDVSFTDKWSDELNAYYYHPKFGSSVKGLEGKEVYIKGYMLAVDPVEGIFILSRNPFASCFFCGASGPESIVELELTPGHPRFYMDQIVTIKGIFRLNKDNVYQCNYIIEAAEVYKP